jgi:hypothetical protein
MWHLAYTLTCLAAVGVFFGFVIIGVLRMAARPRRRQWRDRDEHEDGC